MRNRISFKNHQQETQLFNRRCVAVSFIVAIFTLLLLTRLVYLQVDQHRFYTTLSRHNLMKIIPIEPNRGLIYDRNGVLLAKNLPVFSVDIIPGRTPNLANTITELQKLIQLSPTDITSFYHSLGQHRPYQAVVLKVKLTASEMARIYVNQYRLPGVHIEARMMRYYPQGIITGDVVGYVSRINAKELQNNDLHNYSSSDDIGKVGIEKYDETELRGTMGAEEVETNASGRVIRILKRIAPVPGTNLYLTIDSKLQAFAETLLKKQNGAIVALQPDTGQVLTLVTMPTYNPNPFVNGISQKAFNKLLQAPGNPLYNRALSGQYASGSTIKVFYAIGALDAGIITQAFKLFCKGWFQLPGTKHIYHDWKRTGHEWVNITKAIRVSCDIFFYKLAVKMGIHFMDRTLQEFGFGTKTGINIGAESTGLVPSPHWKRHTLDTSWFTGDTIITGIGQGFLLVTPLQLAVATATIAEHGMRLRPTLILKTQQPEGPMVIPKPIAKPAVILNNPNNWNIVISAMKQVISNPHGTADLFGRHAPYTAAAKTGTAQVFGKSRDEELVRMNIPKRLRNNHLFIVFAPIKHPKIVVAIVVEHASYADRMGRKIIDFYFNELKNQQAASPSPKGSTT